MDVLKPILITTVELAAFATSVLSAAVIADELISGRKRPVHLQLAIFACLISTVFGGLTSLPDLGIEAALSLVIPVVGGVQVYEIRASRLSKAEVTPPRRTLRRRLWDVAATILPALTVATIFALFFLNLSGSQMWLPSESIQQKSRPARLQYALRDDGDDLVVFDANKSTVIRIAKSSILHRQYCATSYPTGGMQYCPGALKPPK